MRKHNSQGDGNPVLEKTEKRTKKNTQGMRKMEKGGGIEKTESWDSLGCFSLDKWVRESISRARGQSKSNINPARARIRPTQYNVTLERSWISRESREACLLCISVVLWEILYLSRIKNKHNQGPSLSDYISALLYNTIHLLPIQLNISTLKNSAIKTKIILV